MCVFKQLDLIFKVTHLSIINIVVVFFYVQSTNQLWRFEKEIMEFDR